MSDPSRVDLPPDIDHDRARPPRVSIVMPVFNAALFLDEALLSARRQTMADLEILIVDDGSTDASREIARRHCGEDSRCRLLRTERAGAAGARNRAISEARGAWIAFLDSDDVWSARKLELQLELASFHPGLAAVATWAYFIGSRGQVVGLRKVGPLSLEEHAARVRDGATFQLVTASALIRTSRAKQVGGIPKLQGIAEDLAFFTEIAQLGPVLTIPQPLTGYRVHASSLTASNIFRQGQVSRWLRHNLRARRTGAAQTPFEQFLELDRRRPFLCRWNTNRRELAMHHYRVAGVHLAEKRWLPGAAGLAMSALLSPLATTWRFARNAAGFARLAGSDPRA